LRPQYPRHIWSIDFVHDKLSSGRSYKMLTVIDEYTREALCVAAKPRMGHAEVLDALYPLFLKHGKPHYIRSDNGSEIVALAEQRQRQSKKAQKIIDSFTKVLGEMMDTGVQIDRLTRMAEVRNHYCGDSFSSRIAQALGPVLKPFGILAHMDSSHPKFGTPLTVGEGTGDDCLVLLDRGRRESEKMDERRAKVKASGAVA
jgi:hypothetical protein